MAILVRLFLVCDRDDGGDNDKNDDCRGGGDDNGLGSLHK